MSEWKTYRLGDLCSRIKSGKGIPASEVSTTGEYPVIGGNGIRGYTNTSNFNGVCAVVGRQGAYCGNVRFFSGEAYMTEHAVVIVGNELADTRYLAYLLSIMQLGHLSAQSAQPGLSVQTLSKLSINIPDISTQRRIAGILGSLDDKIELNRRINANLEAQAQALFRSWFVDFEPFRDGPFVDSELGKIPQGWKVGDIYTYMDVIYGAPYKSALFNTNKKGYPLIRIRDLKTYSPQFYTEEILPNTEYVDFGDIVAGMDAEFVPYIWKGEKGLLNQRVCKFIPKYDYVSKYYILSLIRPELEFVQSYKVGTTVSHLGKSDIDKFKVITPPAEIIKRFSCIVDSFHQQIIKLAKENLNLSTLRDTLLPNLMAGEIK